MRSLADVFRGWDGYQTSLLRAVAPLTAEQLAWRPAEGRRSIGELVRHISLGRITWIARLHGPGMEEAAARVVRWHTDGDGSHHAVEQAVSATDAKVLAGWLETSWGPIARILDEWTVDDLDASYRHRYSGVDYDVSRQWTIWRVMCHDCHHGGQIATMLAMQGIEALELRALGGHITEPPKTGS